MLPESDFLKHAFFDLSCFFSCRLFNTFGEHPPRGFYEALDEAGANTALFALGIGAVTFLHSKKV